MPPGTGSEYVDPDFKLSVVTKAQWNNWSDTGYNDPTYDKPVHAAGDDRRPQEAAGAGLEDGGVARPDAALHPARRHEPADGERRASGRASTPTSGVLQVLLHEPAPDRMTRERRGGADAVRRADYVVKRTVYALVTVFVAITLNFFLFRVVPGDAVSGLRCQSLHASSSRPRSARSTGSTSRSAQQYVIYLERLAHGDLGTSVVRQRAGLGRHQVAAPEHAADDHRRHALLDPDRHRRRGRVRLAARHAASTRHPVDGLAFYAMPTQWIGLLVIFYVAVARRPAASGHRPTRRSAILGPRVDVDVPAATASSTCSCRRSRSASASTASTR